MGCPAGGVGGTALGNPPSGGPGARGSDLGGVGGSGGGTGGGGGTTALGSLATGAALILAVVQTAVQARILDEMGAAVNERIRTRQ